MEFRITESEAQRLAELETESGGMISAGPDFRDRLRNMIRLELFGVDYNKVIKLLNIEFGNVLSRDEIEEVAADLQTQIERRLIQKMVAQKSA